MLDAGGGGPAATMGVGGDACVGEGGNTGGGAFHLGVVVALDARGGGALGIVSRK